MEERDGAQEYDTDVEEEEGNEGEVADVEQREMEETQLGESTLNEEVTDNGTDKDDLTTSADTSPSEMNAVSEETIISSKSNKLSTENTKSSNIKNGTKSENHKMNNEKKTKKDKKSQKKSPKKMETDPRNVTTNGEGADGLDDTKSNTPEAAKVSNKKRKRASENSKANKKAAKPRASSGIDFDNQVDLIGEDQLSSDDDCEDAEDFCVPSLELSEWPEEAGKIVTSAAPRYVGSISNLSGVKSHMDCVNYSVYTFINI